MSIPRWCHQILRYHGVPYKELHHPPVFSASRLARAEHVSGLRVAKTVLLNAGNHPVAVVLPACARLDLGRVQAVLGTEDLRLADEAEIAGWFKGCRPGCVPPLRLRSDELLLMDRSLAHLNQIVFAAGTPEDAVAVRFRDWFRAARPGVGSFTLPADEAAAPEPPTVLVVEDEADTNQLLCRLLERAGVVCHGVEGGNEALAAAQKVRPAAILLDLMLPDMSGFEMYERLQRDGPTQHIPCIVMTALDDEEARRRGEQLGVDAYLIKPFRPRALVTELQDILAGTRP
jgi:CheY-like chemotaxis protein/prolyl-tRNA editing enzyme YbaK/EbsC (Cys-tRNA(Pro) deacylase)